MMGETIKSKRYFLTQEFSFNYHSKKEFEDKQAELFKVLDAAEKELLKKDIEIESVD